MTGRCGTSGFPRSGCEVSYSQLTGRFCRIWDTRHLHSIRSHPFTPAHVPQQDSKDPGSSDPDKLRLDHTGHSPALYPSVLSEWDEDVFPAMKTKKHAGLLRAESAHEKSCSAAYWDPAGRRVLTTCYDDRIRGTSSSWFLACGTSRVCVVDLSGSVS